MIQTQRVRPVQMLNQTENHQQFDWNQNEFAFCEKQKNHLNNVRKYCRKQTKNNHTTVRLWNHENNKSFRLNIFYSY